MVIKVFKINVANVCDFILLRDPFTPMIPLELLKLEKCDGFGYCKPVTSTRYGFWPWEYDLVLGVLENNIN